ncbi:MAG: hypothetical protein N3G22_01105 [Candidatus Micrarchaeota archaeon]|nr:hypothetical protein [Candidatus Micrarchaeota archaeon]
MEVIVKERRENPALSRTELACEVSFEKSVPSRKQLREAICAATGFPPEAFVIISVKGEFGTHSAFVRAHAYKNKEAMKIERKYLLVRDGLIEKQAKAKEAKAAKK